MKEFITYSPAMLKTFEQCKKKFEYKYIKGLSIPVDTTKMKQGKNLHAIANYYLKNFNIDKFEKVLSEQEMILWNNLKNTKYFNFETINSEYNLTGKVENYWISGRLDALVKDKDENYYILDYKTGQIPKNPEYDYQTIIYLLIADKFIKNYNTLSFVYIDLKNNQTHEIIFTPQKKEEYEKKLVTILKDIEKCTKLNIFNKCKNTCICEFNKLCN